MSDSWYKVDNVAKVFLATASQRDPRVFRISCTLNEEIDPDTLNEALRSTAQEWPQFQVTLHRGLFWHYFESTDQLPTAQPETKAPCAPLYTPERRNNADLPRNVFRGADQPGNVPRHYGRQRRPALLKVHRAQLSGAAPSR